MRLLMMTALTCALVAGCTTPAGPYMTTATIDCTPQERPMGSNIARRDSCIVQTDETRAEARRQAEVLRDDSTRLHLPMPGAGGR